MAVGKPLNKKSFYGSEGGADIEMPPLNETPPIQSAAQDPWQAQSENSDSEGMAPVPDALPQEVLYEMQAEDSEGEEVAATPAPPTKAKETSAAANIRALREEKEKAQRERDELMRLLQMQMQNQQSAPKEVASEEEPEDDFKLGEEDLVEGKYFKQMNKKVRDLEKQLRNYQHQSAEALVEAKIKAQFPDFERVVSRENVEILNETHPEIARIS